MSELHIPGKLKSIVSFSSVPMWSGHYRDAARYMESSDTIVLDPNLADVSIVSEELWHRKQRQIINRLGLPYYTKEDDKFFVTNSAQELGIAPRTRGIAVRLNLEPQIHHQRYFYLLGRLWNYNLRKYREESLGYFQALKGEKLFDGLAFVIEECFKTGFNLQDEYWERLAYSGDQERNNLFWEKVNKARKSW